MNRVHNINSVMYITALNLLWSKYYHLFFLQKERGIWTDWWLTAEQRSSFFHLNASIFLPSAPCPPSLFPLARLILPDHLSSLTSGLIVRRGEGCFMVHTETSGRGTLHNLLWPEIPSLHICQRMFALFDCWGQSAWNPVCTKCKQKLLFLFCFHHILIFPNIIPIL